MESPRKQVVRRSLFTKTIFLRTQYGFYLDASTPPAHVAEDERNDISIDALNSPVEESPNEPRPNPAEGAMSEEEMKTLRAKVCLLSNSQLC